MPDPTVATLSDNLTIHISLSKKLKLCQAMKIFSSLLLASLVTTCSAFVPLNQVSA